MQALVIFLAVVLFIIVTIALICIGIYNKIIRRQNEFNNAYAQIDVQLQRRYELIPNLVESAKAFMSHEKETLQGVIEARNQAQRINIELANNPANPELMRELMTAEQTLGNRMGGFYAVMENYPELKADTTMNGLMEELTSTENKVAFARQHFNDAILSYNNHIQEFPNNLIAGMFNFKVARPLEIADEKMREAVKVSFKD